MIYNCCVRQKKCRSILKHVLKRCDNRKSCRRPVVSLSHATKSYRVNRPLPRPENGPGTQAGKERVLYYLQAHARNDAIFSPKTGGKTIFGKRFLIWA